MIKVLTKIEQDWNRVRALEKRIATRVLFRVGGYGRTAMKNGFRKKKGSSVPPAPPHSHAGQLRDLSAFQVDQAEGSVTVVVKLYKARMNRSGAVIPELLDQGGSQVVEFRVGKRRRTVRKTVRYRARPFVQPAFEKTYPQLGKFIEQSK